MSYNSEMNRVIFVSGPSNSGKTTLIEMLIPRLRRKGVRVGTIKHAHQGCEIDQPGKDSWRHTQAGAEVVAILSPQKTILLQKTESEMTLGRAIERMKKDIDLILVEGFKNVPGRKILIEPHATDRVQMNHQLCRVGIFPEKLSPDELDKIIQFCEGDHGRNRRRS